MMACRHVLRTLGSIAVCWLLSASISPVDADMFKIDGLEVDEEGSDSVAARRAAIANAERQGFDLLLRRLTATVDHPLLPTAENRDVSRYVRSIDIGQERLSSTRYVAIINVAYQPEPIQQLLQGAGIAYVTEQRPDILVVPALYEDGRLRLAARTDPWGAIWRRIGASGGMVGFSVIDGTAEDAQVLAASGEGANPAAFALIADRYAADEVLLAVEEEKLTTGFRYRLSGVHNLDLERNGLITASDPAEQVTALRRILADQTAALAAAWKANNLVRADQVSSLDLSVDLANFQDWVQINGELEGLSLVRTVDVREFARTHARLRIDYVGQREDLDAALSARGLALIQEDSSWRLRRADGLPGLAGG